MNVTSMTYAKEKQDAIAARRVFDRRIDHCIKWILFAALLIGIVWMLVGCATIQTASVTAPSGNIARLEARTDAIAAVKAAPGFVQDSLDTVAELEDQIKEMKVK